MARLGSSLSLVRLSLALSVMAAICAASAAQQQPAAVPSPPSCPPVLASLLPCVSYFIGNSSSPSDACCSQMQAMFQSQAPCLCAAVAAAPSQLGSVLGQAPALMPSTCNLPPNACTGATGTGSAPPAAGGSTAPSTGTTDAAAAAPVTGPSGTIPPATPSGGGLKSVPTFVDSAAVGAECKRISAAVALALASFLAAYVC